METPIPNPSGVCFDIETSGDPETTERLMPPFAPEEIKVGNLGPDKAKEKIEQARASHEADWREKAALRPETGKILAIGYYSADFGVEICTDRNLNTEKELIQDFWKRLEQNHKSTGSQFIGFNNFSFDQPYLVIRSRILGIPVPGGLRHGRYWNPNKFADLREDFLCGRDWRENKSSMDYVARVFGLAPKTGSGRDFAAMYQANEVGALSYLAHDVLLTRDIAIRLGYNFNPTTNSFQEWLDKYHGEKPAQKPPDDGLF